MWAADFVGIHQMEHLQSLILLSVFMVSRFARLRSPPAECGQNNRDRGEASWALLGAAIKVSIGPGSRNGPYLLTPSADGAGPGSQPLGCRATSARGQAFAHVDRSVGEPDPAGSRAANMVEPGLSRLGHGAQLQLFVQYPSGPE